MSRIEELPDVSDTSYASQAKPEPPITSSPETPFPIRAKPHSQDASTTPSLPPAMDSVRSHSADEIVQMMKKTPLFMTDLEDGGDDGGNPSCPAPSWVLLLYYDDNTKLTQTTSIDNEGNIQLEALRALQYEGTRREVALGFKERGNEMVAEKRWKDAKEFYTKGILALKAPRKEEDDKTSDDEEAEEKKVEEACYTNRALCNLEL
ncbi:MAG: hypothetical protein L6R35_004756, partial [Caloplaca aegaea]